MKTPSESEAALLGMALGKPIAERGAWLQAVCGEDHSLRERLNALLAESDGTPVPLPDCLDRAEDPTLKLHHAAGPRDETVGQTLGRFKLLERVGEGGCGVVYVAEQTQPVRRRVALKVIKLGMDTREVIARFEAERQALAMMDHPNIARVLDAGTTELGRPYFVMELVRGIPITDYCDQANLDTKARLDLFIKVCQAIQHAHQKGIIHRDMKPSNILVTLHDGVPVPKVIDFGIAKATEGRLTDSTVYTQLHQFIGTPAYMSPEQAEMSGLDIDTRSDIYSLGVLLYELLAGSTPFDAGDLMAQGIDGMRRTIREKEPQRPSTKLSQTLVAANVSSLKSSTDGKPTTEEEVRADSRRLLRAKETITQIKGDLDWIVMKCLEKDRARRYETANGLAADITRHLTNEPVLARPASTAYKFKKAFRRNKLVFATVAAVAVALILGVIGTTAGLLRAEKQRHAAEEARRLAEQRFQSARQFVNDVFQKVEPEFSKLIGASKAGEALARISLTFIESLGDPEQSDEAFQADLAELYLRLADALGEPYGENSLGDYEAALRFANQSLALWKDLARKDSSNFERERKIGILEQRVASILWELGKYGEAKPLFLSSLSRSEAEVKVDPQPARAASNLALSHYHAGVVLEHEGHFQQALEEHYLPYGKAWLERPLAWSDDIDTAHNCYVAHVLVGNALLKLSRPDEALVHLEKAFGWVKIKLEMDPNNARAARDRIELLALIGAAQLGLGQTELGAQSLDEAVRHADALVARDPANGPAQLQFIGALQAHAKGFATQATLPGISSARQVELWQRAIQTLARCQQRLDTPEMRRNKASLETEAKRIAQAMNEAQAALAKIAANVGPISPLPAKDKPRTNQP